MQMYFNSNLAGSGGLGGKQLALMPPPAVRSAPKLLAGQPSHNRSSAQQQQYGPHGPSLVDLLSKGAPPQQAHRSGRDSNGPGCQGGSGSHQGYTSTKSNNSSLRAVRCPCCCTVPCIRQCLLASVLACQLSMSGRAAGGILG